jgi:spermidine synthase
VVELDPRVLAAARQQFHLPPDDARFVVEIGDGAEALAPECCDVLVVDAFHDEEHVPELASQAFYDAAYLALAEPGALVVNFMDDDRNLDANLRRLEAAFGGSVVAMKALYDPNVIAFALKGEPHGAPWSIEWDLLRKRAGRYLPRLRGMNRCTSRELIIRP